MNPVKRLIGTVARKLAPDTIQNLEYVNTLRHLGDRLPAVVQRVDELQARLDRAESQLAELDGVPYAVDELRRDSLRIAELTDLVVTTLGTLPKPEPTGQSRQ